MIPTDAFTHLVVFCTRLSYYFYFLQHKGYFHHQNTHYGETYPIVVVRVKVIRTDPPYSEDEWCD